MSFISLNNHFFRKALMLSLNEMAVLREIYSLSNNTKYHGWCVKSKTHISETLDLSKQTVMSTINKLIANGLVDKDEETKYLKPSDFLRSIAQESENIGFYIKSGEHELYSAKIKELIHGNSDGKEIGTPYQKFDHSGKEIGTESVKKFDHSILYSTSENIIRFLNEKADRNFDPKTTNTFKLITARLKKYTDGDFFDVIELKVKQWGNDEKMRKYLNPDTLFNESNFEKYYNEVLDARKKNTHIQKTDGNIPNNDNRKYEDPFAHTGIADYEELMRHRREITKIEQMNRQNDNIL